MLADATTTAAVSAPSRASANCDAACVPPRLYLQHRPVVAVAVRSLRAYAATHAAAVTVSPNDSRLASPSFTAVEALASSQQTVSKSRRCQVDCAPPSCLHCSWTAANAASCRVHRTEQSKEQPVSCQRTRCATGTAGTQYEPVPPNATASAPPTDPSAAWRSN